MHLYSWLLCISAVFHSLYHNTVYVLNGCFYFCQTHFCHIKSTLIHSPIPKMSRKALLRSKYMCMLLWYRLLLIALGATQFSQFQSYIFPNGGDVFFLCSLCFPSFSAVSPKVSRLNENINAMFTYVMWFKLNMIEPKARTIHYRLHHFKMNLSKKIRIEEKMKEKNTKKKTI